MTEENKALLEVHGVSPEHTDEQAGAVGRAMLIALGAAGRISAKEMEGFVAIAIEYGATHDLIVGWRKFNYADAEIAEQIDLTGRLARHMMYDAIRIVRAGAPPGPCPKLAAVARALGVHVAVATTLDGVATADQALRGMRSTVEAATKGRPGGVPAGAEAGLASIIEEAAKLRELRIKTMDEEPPFPKG
jgi:hypothetical protein